MMWNNHNCTRSKRKPYSSRLIEFDRKRYGVKSAKWSDILLFVITMGRKGKTFDIVDMSYMPPNNVNCRCRTVGIPSGK